MIEISLGRSNNSIDNLDIVTPERWKDIEGYEDSYQVSNKGNVRNKKFDRPLSVFEHRTGYMKVNLYKNNKSRQYSVHRLVSKAFIPNPKDKPCVNHLDGDKSNNNVDNLEWVTYSENAKHAYKIGLAESPAVKGEQQGNSKLTEEEVLKIRELVKTDRTNREVGDMFGVAPNTVSAIKHRTYWKHI